MGISNEPERRKEFPWEREIPVPPPLTEEELEADRRRREQQALADQQRERNTRWAAFCEVRGRRYADARFSNYDANLPEQRDAVAVLQQYANEMRVRLAEGDGVVLFGPPGTGKDHLMAALARVAILQHGMSVMWKNGMDLFGEIRDRIDTDAVEERFVSKLAYPNVLAISDPLPPFGSLTSFQSMMLFRIIEARYNAMKPLWVTMNVKNSEEAAERMGVQLVDRLKDRSLAVWCNWPSYRKAR